jgi:hypothetical protein
MNRKVLDLVTPRQLAALVRRHLVAVAVALILAAGLTYHLDKANPGYADNATVAFTAPSAELSLFSNGLSLLVMNQLMANSIMSGKGRDEVSAAGGTARYSVAMVNLNDEDFPNYGVPYLAIGVAASSAAGAQETFSAVIKVLTTNLGRIQAQQGAKPKAWIQLRTIAASTGPIAQNGSKKRMLAGLAVLTLIAALLLAMLLDRYPVRPARVRDLFRRDLFRENDTPEPSPNHLREAR